MRAREALIVAGVWIAVALVHTSCGQGLLGGGKVLVVLDDETRSDEYGTLLKSIRDAGFETVTKEADDAQVTLRSGLMDYGYAGVVLLAPKAKTIGKDVTIAAFQKYLEHGGSVMMAVEPNYTDFMSELAASMAVQLDEKNTMIIDHGSYQTGLDDGTHTKVIAGGVWNNKPFLDGSAISKVCFSGVGASLDRDNQLAHKIAWGSKTAYSHKPTELLETTPTITGEDAVMVTAVQTRVGSRAVYVGSASMLTDKLIEDCGADHAQFVARLAAWWLGDRGVLLANNLRYHAEGESEMRPTYRVKDDLVVSIDVFEWQRAERAWVPLDETDLQVEFTSLDPYVRARLVSDGNGTFHAEIPVPDHIGLYKFVVEYFRPGYTPISVSKTLSVRPFNHNEYDRFIFRALPYYIAALLNILGILVFGLVFLYSKEDTTAPTTAASSTRTKTD